jgi:aspartate aminotransferase-like enzyme
MGLELLSPKSPSNSVTAVLLPPSIKDGNLFIAHLKKRFGITVAEGQDKYKGKMFRIAHLGFFDELDLLSFLTAAEMGLSEMGHSLEFGKGVGAAARYFSETAR